LYWVEVINTTSGCKKRDSINVAFTAAPAFNLGIDTTICAADTIILNATVANATSYLWNTGATTATLKAYQAGLYWCNVSKGSCSFRDSLTITAIKPSPVVNLGADQTVCEGTTVTLNATYPGAAYQWQDGNTNPMYNVTQKGIYSVKLDLNGCKRSDTVKINYNLKPVFTLGPDQMICPGNTITLAPVVDPAWQLLWQDGKTNPVYTITQTGVYSLAATNNCGTTTDAIQISKGLCSVYIPNAFTPNGDSKNDLFKIFGTELVTEFNLKIFNRYGQIVFETADKNKGWDGKLNGQASPAGGFIYLMAYKENGSPELRQVKGTFILIR
jgi:gliding motility-associated-like protein